MSRPLGPPLAGPTMIKRGPKRARRGCRPSPLIWTCRSCEAGSPALVHLPQDRQGLPLGAVLSAGQRRRSAFFVDLVNEVSVPRPKDDRGSAPKRPKGDRAYDATWIRRWLADRGIESAIPVPKDLREGPGRPPTCDEQKYRDRNTVERCVGHLKERRRLVVRYEKKSQPHRSDSFKP
ncbi:transposase [Salinibacter ruber]|nr:transposase [Salinibacter ruber]